MTTAQEYAQLAQIAADEAASDSAATESAKQTVLNAQSDVNTSLSAVTSLEANAHALVDLARQWSESVNTTLDGSYSAKHYALLTAQYLQSVIELNNNIIPAINATLIPIQTSLDTVIVRLNTGDFLQDVTQDDIDEVAGIAQSLQEALNNYLTTEVYQEDKIDLFGAVAGVQDFTKYMTEAQKDEYATQLLTKIVSDESLANQLRTSGYFIDAQTGKVGLQQVVERLNSMLGSVSREITTVTNDVNNVVAQEITTLQTQISEVEQSITTTLQPLTNEVTQITNTYGVRLNADGHVAGFGIIQDLIDGSATSDFIVSADNFMVVPPAYVGATAPTTNLYDGMVWKHDSTNIVKYYHESTATWELTAPARLQMFKIQTTPVTVDGVEVPPGVYLDAAYIADASIDQAKIGALTVSMADVTGTLSANRIVGGTLTADLIDGQTISGLTIIGSNITGGTVSATDITASTITATTLTTSLLVESASAKATDAGLPHLGYTVGVTSSTSTSAGGGSALGVALTIKPYNYLYTDTSTTIDYTSNQWRYRRESVTPYVSGHIDVTSASQDRYDEYRNISVALVTIKIYTAQSGGTLIAQHTFDVRLVAQSYTGTRTLTASSNGCSFTLSYGLDYFTTSDGWTSWAHNRVNTQDIQYSVNCSFAFNDNDSTGIYATIEYGSLNAGFGLGTKYITIADEAENDY